MQVKIYLLSSHGTGQLTQVLRAVQTTRPTKRSHLDPFKLLIGPVEWLVKLGFIQLERAVQPGVRQVCRFAERLYIRLTRRTVFKVG